MARLPDSIIRALEDGKPHDVSEVAEETKLTEKQIQQVFDFLVEYGFAKKVGKSIEVDPELRTLEGSRSSKERRR